MLLLEAMKDTGMAAVGRFVLRGNETFCLIRPAGDALALETLFLAEDVRSQAEIEEAVGETEVKDAELDLARQVIDEPRRRVRARPSSIASTARTCASCSRRSSPGEEIVEPEPVAEDAGRRPDGSADARGGDQGGEGRRARSPRARRRAPEEARSREVIATTPVRRR